MKRVSVVRIAFVAIAAVGGLLWVATAHAGHANPVVCPNVPVPSESLVCAGAFVNCVGTDGDDHITVTGGFTDALVVAAGKGNDQIDIVNDANNVVCAGQGIDTVNITGDGDNVVQGGHDLDIITINGDGHNLVRGGHDNDEIFINGNGDNRVEGGQGADIVRICGSGENVIEGGPATDSCFAGDNGTEDCESPLAAGDECPVDE